MAIRTVVSNRVGPSLVRINGEPAIRTTAREGAFCAHSLKPINRGDKVYRLWGGEDKRRWLASEIEKLG